MAHPYTGVESREKGVGSGEWGVVSSFRKQIIHNSNRESMKTIPVATAQLG
ncbi:MAG: hypothetical protein DSM107014_14600 [Gomphosphaeria aponina SAG 52.96 = DSM 107014]|uniref:Uncharacterized protein n=1 Tax=Gomphosphaeria aponina SAG 52.96 = DSM 107014 TaxID=1521640 RepID=A0A941GRM9_9CHRO|nr:hypothetical protein [Gomphosphaeria aponina SAG 52.96 = DSM 107014]